MKVLLGVLRPSIFMWRQQDLGCQKPKEGGFSTTGSASNNEGTTPKILVSEHIQHARAEQSQKGFDRIDVLGRTRPEGISRFPHTQLANSFVLQKEEHAAR